KEAEYHLSKPWLRCGEGTSFADAWEKFCFEMLEREHGRGAMDWRRPKDRGVDIFYSSEGIAYQCKSVESGKDGDFSVEKSAESMREALAFQSEIGFRKYTICTNVEISGSKQDSLRKIFRNVEFRTRKDWIKDLDKSPDIAAAWFRVPVRITFLK